MRSVRNSVWEWNNQPKAIGILFPLSYFLLLRVTKPINAVPSNQNAEGTGTSGTASILIIPVECGLVWLVSKPAKLWYCQFPDPPDP
jgi:hypothetical protein